MIATRESDGQTAIVATTIDLVTSGTVDIALTATTPFSSTDIIYFDAPSEWISLGDYDWTKTGLGGFQKYSPSAENAYRNLQGWMGQIMGLRGLGLFHPNYHEVQGLSLIHI